MPLSRLDRIRLMRPATRLARRYVADGDAWQSLPHDVPLTLYGSGHLGEDFQFYLQGPSCIPVKSIDELCHWLRKCQYQHDSVLFGRNDFWQHPTGFENLRRGDCEDHALWAWRKLIELGHKAELVIGRSRQHDATDEVPHAWVIYTENGNRFLFEATEKSRQRMIRPLADVSAQYSPYASVDQDLQRRLYAGFIDWLQKKRERKRARKQAALSSLTNSGKISGKFGE